MTVEQLKIIMEGTFYFFVTCLMIYIIIGMIFNLINRLKTKNIKKELNNMFYKALNEIVEEEQEKIDKKTKKTKEK